MPPHPYKGVWWHKSAGKRLQETYEMHLKNTLIKGVKRNPTVLTCANSRYMVRPKYIATQGRIRKRMPCIFSGLSLPWNAVMMALWGIPKHWCISWTELNFRSPVAKNHVCAWRLRGEAALQRAWERVGHDDGCCWKLKSDDCESSLR